MRAGGIASTLQTALDDWEDIAPQLAALAGELETGIISGFHFRDSDCKSPLPRAYHRADGSAYVAHVTHIGQARGAEMPESFSTDLLTYKGCSDSFLAPHDPVPMPGDESLGLDLEAKVAGSGDAR